MDFEMQFEMRPQYLYVRVAGVYSLEAARRSFSKGLEVIDQNHAAKVLVDCRQVSGTPSLGDYYSYGEFIAQEQYKPTKTGRMRRPQLAYVAIKPLMNKAHFAQLVATNRGANMRSFENMEDALRWLGVEPANENGENT